MNTGHSEAELFWIEFLCSLAHRGLRNTKLVVSDVNGGLKAAITKVLSTTWQRCRALLLNIMFSRTLRAVRPCT